MALGLCRHRRESTPTQGRPPASPHLRTFTHPRTPANRRRSASRHSNNPEPLALRSPSPRSAPLLSTPTQAPLLQHPCSSTPAQRLAPPLAPCIGAAPLSLRSPLPAGPVPRATTRTTPGTPSWRVGLIPPLLCLHAARFRWFWLGLGLGNIHNPPPSPPPLSATYQATQVVPPPQTPQHPPPQHPSTALSTPKHPSTALPTAATASPWPLAPGAPTPSPSAPSRVPPTTPTPAPLSTSSGQWPVRPDP